jgi:hypothetical protein
LFLAGSCSERGRLGNTIFQRAAGHALESIDLAQIRFVLCCFYFCFSGIDPACENAICFAVLFGFCPWTNYGQTVGNISAHSVV